MSIGGIVSGLETDKIIESLLKVEGIPQAMLVNKKTNTESFVTALQALNTKLDSLKDMAAKVALGKSYDVWKGSSSNSSVSVATKEGASATTLEFRVDKLATGRSILSGAMADASGLLNPDGAFTFTNGEGETKVVFPDSESLVDLAAAINQDSSLGIKATLVTTSEGSRLQLTSDETGAQEGNFAVTSGQGETNFTQIRQSEDAQLTLWPGLNLPGSTVTSASNTFEEISPGIALTVTSISKDTDAPIVVNVVKDKEAITKLGEDLVSQLNQVLEEIASRSKVTTEVVDGKTTVKAGIFAGDSMSRQITTLLQEAGLYPVDGKSPTTIGISMDKDGKFAFDKERFAEALDKDPAETQRFLSQLAGRVESVGKTMSDPYEGSLTMRIQGQNNLVTEYGKQIENWDIRLAQRRQTLVKMYTAMEVALSNLQAQSSRLGSQLGAMNGQGN
ncbi:flagellar filament capping protein FliD [Jonesiaceae bacterium BS-20]|uniref:Flagellar hook-associated protein 2 n=1 Tax=Jonesiaceae bacterium BS-20 TaxID=3120821 RepID=A0AAU7E0M9_9MICO